MSTEKDLIRDIRPVGIEISSIWDLVNGPDDYKAALPILIQYLQSAEDPWFKEGIVRALATEDAHAATPYLLAEYWSSKDELYKWAIGNTLSVIAPKEALDELIKIMGDRSHGTARQMIAYALGRIRDKAAVKVLLESLDDEGVAGHAIEALGMIGDASARGSIAPFLKHKKAWIRKAAAKALNRLAKNS